jgi:uncharacterized cupin superfamily protein
MTSSIKMRLGVVMTALTCGFLAISARADDLSPTDVPHGKLEDFQWVPEPRVGGSQSIIYRSPDGKRVAIAFKERGKGTYTFPFDEFFYVISGSMKVHVHGGQTFAVKEGEVCYMREGMTVDWEADKDFYAVAYLSAEHDTGWK